MIGAAFLTVGRTVFFPNGLQASRFTDISFWIFLCLFAVSAVLVFQKMNLMWWMRTYTFQNLLQFCVLSVVVIGGGIGAFFIIKKYRSKGVIVADGKATSMAMLGSTKNEKLVESQVSVDP